MSKASRSPNNLQLPILFRVGMTKIYFSFFFFFFCVVVVKVERPFICYRARPWKEAPHVHQLWVEKQALKLSEFIYLMFGDLVGLFNSESCY